MAERLESRIDRLAKDERLKERFKRRSLFWIPAAAAILGVILLIGDGFKGDNPRMADTYSDPEEAALVAQEALAFMSKNLNKGLNQMDDAGKDIVRINSIINKQIK
ncbi:hypothetical protein EVA_15635 [gut metagenome]|uniref:Uncharacterized protein n=1 Tax=gut metagenome TaxID=749906 RepID=J9G9Y3_9ZZZZ